MPNQEVMQEWVAELRSGRHKQGKSHLHQTNGKKCCLGILCEIAVKHEVIPPPVISACERGCDCQACFTPQVYLYEHEAQMPPPKVMEWAGLHVLEMNLSPMKLATLNDEGRPFEDIADLIEANWMQNEELR